MNMTLALSKVDEPQTPGELSARWRLFLNEIRRIENRILRREREGWIVRWEGRGGQKKNAKPYVTV